MSTGEYWNGLMHDLMDQGHTFAFVYFASFTVLAEFIMLNLVVAVLLINYDEQQQNKEREEDETGQNTNSGNKGSQDSSTVAVDEATPVSSSFRSLDSIPSPRGASDDTNKTTISEEPSPVFASTDKVTLRPASPATPAPVSVDAERSQGDNAPVPPIGADGHGQP